jgi:hypothetical protein
MITGLSRRAELFAIQIVSPAKAGAHRPGPHEPVNVGTMGLLEKFEAAGPRVPAFAGMALAIP